jgi:putative ABC transport system permease protein
MALARHILIVWARNIAANRILCAIAILGLALGLAGAILMALVARMPLTFNGAVPDAGRIHLAVSVMSSEGIAPDYQPASPARAAGLLNESVAEAEGAARLAEAEVELRRGAASVREAIYWADPQFFSVLRLPALRGDPGRALARPDALVMTEDAAARHFGTAQAIGRTLLVDGRPMILRAVLKDLPRGRTDLASGIFASGLAAESALTRMAQDPPGSFSISVRTYVRVRPAASAERAEERLNVLVARGLPPSLREAYRIELVRIDRLALYEGFHPGASQRLLVGSLVAGLVLFIAVANFVNVAVALAARRRREIGVRKAAGAGRRQIAVQFLGEAILSVFLAMLVAAAATEWLLPMVNLFLGTEAQFDYVEEPALLLWLLAGALLLGLAAGAYPALLLSSLKPASVLKGQPPTSAGVRLRNLLVVGQFAILIGLVVATIVVHQQRRFALEDALRIDADGLLTVTAFCPPAFVEEAGKLPGVRGVSCSGRELLTGEMFALMEWRGRRVSAQHVSILPSGFALYGVAPVAGTLPAMPQQGDEQVTRIVLNETAVRRFGFPSNEAALGQALPIAPDEPGPDVRASIVAVVPDFALYSIETPIEPTIYLPRPHGAGFGIVSLRLAGDRLPETLAAIDRLWAATGNEGPIERAFVSDHLESLYGGLERAAQLFGIFSAVAVLLACLGLIGLSLAAAERRTKEIAIRKALGASTGQIVALLLWQLSRPVLWANLIAWPVTWLALRQWLSGYAYHVPLDLWLFPAAGLAALLIAIASVALLAYGVARKRPVEALRYE